MPQISRRNTTVNIYRGYYSAVKVLFLKCKRGQAVSSQGGIECNTKVCINVIVRDTMNKMKIFSYP